MINLGKIWEIFITKYPAFLQGVGITLELAFFTVLFGSLLGLTVAIFRHTSFLPLRWLMNAYVAFIRGTPLLVQVLLIVYGLPQLGVRLPRLTMCVIALVINCGAYMAELIRSGINAVDKGQMEAARSLGMSRLLSTRTIILPQALRYILPAIGNELIALLKETAVAGYVAVVDLTRAGNLIRNNTYDAVNPLMIVALSYLAMVILLTYVLKGFERKLSKGKH